MPDSTRLSDAEIDRIRSDYPSISQEYLEYLGEVGWGEKESGHMIYSGPIMPCEVYPSLRDEKKRVIIGDDTQGYCLGFDLVTKCYGEYSDDGEWAVFQNDFDLRRHLGAA